MDIQAKVEQKVEQIQRYLKFKTPEDFCCYKDCTNFEKLERIPVYPDPVCKRIYNVCDEHKDLVFICSCCEKSVWGYFELREFYSSEPKQIVKKPDGWKLLTPHVENPQKGSWKFTGKTIMCCDTCIKKEPNNSYRLAHESDSD
jgi:hypothetical protein